MHKAILFLFFVSYLSAQTFTRIMDVSNPIASIQTCNNYSGAAWIDYNNDGLLDLFATDSYLFKNLGDGNFEYVESGIGSLQNSNFSEGVRWADFDNDMTWIALFPAIHQSFTATMVIDQFFPMTEGDLSADAPNRGWANAWADYNNDGYVDLFITHPAGFLGSVQNSHFFENNSIGTMTKNSSYQFSQISAPYTVGTWSDYDIDGDMDLFIGSGPANGQANIAVDYLYQNTLMETETVGLERLETDPIATDLQDGQVWNWIDYDNDGDLDAYLTNYGGAPNRFYKNNNGSYVSLSNNMTHNGSFLANTWGDLDNDGDLDVILIGDSGNDFFLNNGDDSFTQVNNEIASLFSVGATLGDYDGDLDLFLSEGNRVNNEKAFFRNDTEN